MHRRISRLRLGGFSRGRRRRSFRLLASESCKRKGRVNYAYKHYKCCRGINLPSKGTFLRIRILSSKYLTSDFLHVHNSKGTETLRLSIHAKELRENILSPMNVLLSSRRVPPVHNVELDTALVTQSTGDDLTLWCGNRLHPLFVSICARKEKKGSKGETLTSNGFILHEEPSRGKPKKPAT